MKNNYCCNLMTPEEYQIYLQKIDNWNKENASLIKELNHKGNFTMSFVEKLADSKLPLCIIKALLLFHFKKTYLEMSEKWIKRYVAFNTELIKALRAHA